MEQVLSKDGAILDPKKEPNISKETLLKMYKTMITVRTIDTKGLRLQRQGRIGFHIPTTGQEATQIGAVAALEDKDWIFPAYREPGMAIYRGLPIQEIIDHYYGNKNDPQKGRRIPGLFGGDPVKTKYVNPSAPIGTQIIQAAGAAYAADYLNDKACSIVFFGDGATSSNDFHSGMNFAGVTKAPCIFFCQNNQWAISVPLAKQTASESIVIKAKAYGIAGIQVDGNDILAVYNAVKEALDRARSGEGPTLIEALTYRMGPHTSSDDPTRYRTQEEVNEQKKRDPIGKFEIYLKSKKILTDELIKKFSQESDEEINSCILEAEKIPPPDLIDIFTDVFAEMPWNLKEQYNDLKRIKDENN
jgi:2-oxoisovalerate dehydrogenase E1 component alpha subunit